MKSISFSPKSGSPGSGSKRLFCLDGFSQRFEKLRVSMTTDGFPQWKPKNEFQNIVLKFSVIISLFATFLAVVGVDLIIVLFPEKFDDIALETLLTTLLAYLSFELMGLCIFVRGFLFSWFFYLDFISILAVIVEVISIDKTSDPLAFWDYCRLHSLHHFPILRTSRGARYAARLSRLSSLRIGKVFAMGVRRNDPFNGITSHFNRKGHDENWGLSTYIKEQFLDAFREQEKNGQVSRHDFTMMVRNMLKLDLEPEEEEVLYRLMTVFGRSQEIKFMEDQIENTESTSNARKHWESMKKSQDPGNKRRLSSSTPPNGFGHSSNSFDIGRVGNFDNDEESHMVSPGIRALLQQESTNFNNNTTTSFKGRRNSLPAALPNNQFSLPAALPTNQLSTLFSKAGSLAGSSRVQPLSQLFSGNLTPSDVGSKPVTPKRGLSRGGSLSNLFKMDARKADFNFSEDDELDDVSVRNLVTKNIEDLKMFEEQNPITSMRLKMTTSIVPLELDTISWGLQLFREVGSLNVPASPRTFAELGTKKRKSKMDKSEFEARLAEVLIIDGDIIFDVLRTFQHKHASAMSQSKKNRRESYREKSLTSLFRSGANGSIDNSNNDFDWESGSSSKSSDTIQKKAWFRSPKVRPEENGISTSGVSRTNTRSYSDPTKSINRRPTRGDHDKLNSSDHAVGRFDQDDDCSSTEDVEPIHDSPLTSSTKNESTQDPTTWPVLPSTEINPDAVQRDDISPPTLVIDSFDRYSFDMKKKSTLKNRAIRKGSSLSPKEMVPKDFKDLPEPEKAFLSEQWIINVIDKVKGQMKVKQKEDIEKDLHFGSGNSIGDHIGRGSIRIAILGVFVALLVAPQLNYPTHTSCHNVNGGSTFRILKHQVQLFGGLTYDDEGLITPTSCSLVREDSDISTVVREYSTFDPPPSSFVSTVARCLKIMHIISTTTITMMTMINHTLIIVLRVGSI